MRLLRPIQVMAHEAVGLLLVDLNVFAIFENKCHEVSMAVEMIRIQKLKRCGGKRNIWRRERDSNPRYPFRYSGFQDRLFQPLTHLSAWVGTSIIISRRM